MNKLLDFKAFLETVRVVRETHGLSPSDIQDAVMAAYRLFATRDQDDMLKAVAIKVVQAHRTETTSDRIPEPDARDAGDGSKGRRPARRKA